MFKNKNIIITICSLLLLVFTTYVIADTFLITRVYSSVTYEETQESTTGLTGTEEAEAEDAAEKEEAEAETNSSKNTSKQTETISTETVLRKGR